MFAPSAFRLEPPRCDPIIVSQLKLAINPSAVSDAPHSRSAQVGCALRGASDTAGLKGAARGEAFMQIQWSWGL